jgi:hypothetical protein
MFTKPFEKELYDKYNDDVLKSIIKNIEIPDHYIVKNKKQYEIDLLIVNKWNMICGYIEGESHAKYWKDKFIFNTVHFLGRKTKYITEKGYYILTSMNNIDAVMIPFNILSLFSPISMRNIYSNSEHIYDIPNENCVFGWKNINDFIIRDIIVQPKYPPNTPLSDILRRSTL